jgi:DNA polymerase-3 subunit epsilon
MRQIFLDTETTGLSPESGDRMVEIGCIEMDNRRLTGRHLHYYLNPERRNGEGAVAVHGLTDEFLSDKPLFASVADEMLEFVRGAEIIIHNASFDVGFLNEELRRCGLPKFSTHVGAVTDTLQMARDQFPGKSNSLDALCKRLEVDNTNRTLHGALIDANLLAEVYIRLTRGQDSLVMDMTDDRGGAAGAIGGPADLSIFVLPILVASPSELADHERVLGEIDKASSGKTLWRAQQQEAVA